MLVCMRWNRKRRALLREFEAGIGSKIEARIAQASDRVESALKTQGSALKLAVTAVWVTGALAVLAGGLYAGNEIRTRYKVKRRTPYDYYAHSGDRGDLEYSVGI